MDSLSLDKQQGLDLLLYQQRVREAVHEARNPLGLIKNYLKILQLTLGESADEQEFTLIEAEVDRVVAILASLQKTESGMHIKTRLRLNKLIRDMHKLLSGAIDVGMDSSITLSLQQEEVIVWANADAMKQILVNLIRNASEALRESGSIVIAARSGILVKDRQYAQLCVSDNGPGISQDILPGLFIDERTTKGGSHTGTGLKIVKRLVDEMDGRIECRSSQEETVFSILIPQIVN